MTMNPEHKKRTIQKCVLVNDEEEAAINRARGKLTFSSYFRRLALGQKPPVVVPILNAKAISELNKIGSNLNQLVRHAHRTNRTADLEKIMSQVFAEVAILGSLINQIETDRMDASAGV